MFQWWFSIVIVAGVLVCPAMMWFGRRGIGPGCAICPPRRDESLEDLQTRLRAVTTRIDEFETRHAAEPVGRTRD
jgi:hypothetical protein